MTQSYDLFVQSRVKSGEDIMAPMTPFRARLLHASARFEDDREL